MWRVNWLQIVILNCSSTQKFKGQLTVFAFKFIFLRNCFEKFTIFLRNCFSLVKEAIWLFKNNDNEIRIEDCQYKMFIFSFAILSKLERQDWLGFSQALSLHYHCWCYPFLSHWSPHLSLMACFFLWPWPPYMVTRCLKEPCCWSQNRLVGYQTLLSGGCALTESRCHRWVKCIWAT